jgi:hypothetical protein
MSEARGRADTLGPPDRALLAHELTSPCRRRSERQSLTDQGTAWRLALVLLAAGAYHPLARVIGPY